MTIAKAEWKPISGHNNKGLGPEEYRFIEQKNSHFHDFGENAKLGNIWIRKKLPVALPIIPEPKNFHEFLEFVEEKFKIPNIYLVQEPPWNSEGPDELF